MLVTVYLLSCLLMGVLGMNRKFGFWGYFFSSIVLTPIIGLLLVFASDPKKVQVVQKSKKKSERSRKHV
ncbi:MAG: hypothetical protein D3913_01695 [Candidatus Electrothrix sp. LOE1_4_5]|nr:hypothetical protein [Candidatus Electrothrix gigas]